VRQLYAIVKLIVPLVRDYELSSGAEAFSCYIGEILCREIIVSKAKMLKPKKTKRRRREQRFLISTNL
jgi:hypothetical protein